MLRLAVAYLVHCYLKAQSIKKNFFFILCAGLLSALLLFDDFFLLHEAFIPRYLGIKEHVVLAAYPILILSFLGYFRTTILSSSYLVLLSSLGFLGLSILVDVVAPYENELEYLIEEGFKFLGIAGWCYYFVRTCMVLVKTEVQVIKSPEVGQEDVVLMATA
ncbi:hypothetical protein [Pontibacter chitinilyticus]|uniref:hypothetical protein n=1 Tax=Pontibacter chitinilyticus TaxID=2674989 RepID=UPI00321ABB52